MYGTAEPECLDYTQYAMKLQESLSEAYAIARKQLCGKQERQAEMYNQKIHGKPHQVGTLVWLLNPQVPRGKSKKLHHCWMGPYKLINRFLSQLTECNGLTTKPRIGSPL